MATLLPTPYGILSFPNLFVPKPRSEGGKPVYSCSIVFDETMQRTPEYKAMQASILKCAQDKWGANITLKHLAMTPFKDAAEKSQYGYPYEEWQEPPERRAGLGAVAILGFLALGVLALLSGAVLAGVFVRPGVGQADATPSPSATAVATAEPTPSPSAGATGSPAASGSPGASGEPVVFPDGFTADAQPCIRGSVTPTGCDSNGASNSGSVDIWVGFTNGTSNDVVGATLIAPDGSTVDGSIDLADIGCTASCGGYTFFPFDGLTPGTYEVRVTRNGDLASTTTFEVS